MKIFGQSLPILTLAYKSSIFKKNSYDLKVKGII